MASSEVAAALAYVCDLAANCGLPVFPCRAKDEIVGGRIEEAKRPLTKHGFKDATTDLEQVEHWWSQHPDALVGVPTGIASRLLVVDVDPEGAEWYHEHASELTCGRVHHTRRGYHLLYRMPSAEIRNSASKIAPGIDIRGEGGYMIWWPAHGLEAVGDLDEITEAPAWLVDQLHRLANPREHNDTRSDGSVIHERGRNDYLSREAYRLRKQGSTAEQILTVLLALNCARCVPPLDDDEVRGIAERKVRNVAPDEAAKTKPVSVEDFHAYMPMHQYIFVPSRELWPAASVNARVAPMTGADGAPLKASAWLDQHRAVEQMTWAPGEPLIIRDRLISHGGWITRTGCTCFNLYRLPQVEAGNAEMAAPWIEHATRVYQDEASHIIHWLAHRVQRPGEKINHALVLGGGQGIGKDTLLEPVKYAVGPWNFAEVAPSHLLGRFNGFVKSVVLRVSEARDLGDVDRYAFYDHMKTYTAAPPDVLRCDEKNIREYAVMNVCGVIITSNHKSDGVYLPADDRRHFVAWSDRTKEDFTADYWNGLWSWYGSSGFAHVAAYLSALDLSQFDPKAPPPKTAAFWDIVDANRAPENAELADALDALGNPAAFTLAELIAKCDSEFREWLQDRRNRRQIPFRMESAGYVGVRNPSAQDGLWTVAGKRRAIYAKSELTLHDRLRAATVIWKAGHWDQ